MEQEIANCHAVYDIATCKKRRVCVTIKKYSVNKPTYIQIRLLAEEEFFTEESTNSLLPIASLAVS